MKQLSLFSIGSIMLSIMLFSPTRSLGQLTVNAVTNGTTVLNCVNRTINVTVTGWHRAVPIHLLGWPKYTWNRDLREHPQLYHQPPTDQKDQVYCYRFGLRVIPIRADNRNGSPSDDWSIWCVHPEYIHAKRGRCKWFLVCHRCCQKHQCTTIHSECVKVWITDIRRFIHDLLWNIWPCRRRWPYHRDSEPGNNLGR